MIIEQLKDRPREKGIAAARGAALFLGAYASVGVAVAACSPELDLNLWWLDLRDLPAVIGDALKAVFALVMLAFGACPSRMRAWRRFSAAVAFAVAFLALANAWVFWSLALSGRIRPGSWIPISLLLAITVGWIGRSMLAAVPAARSSRLALFGTFVFCACLFPVVQALGFGKTDYSRAADLAVVFGARVYADGRLSDALEDRVATAASLYRRGLAGRLVMSGGPGDGAAHETEAMRRRAIELGVAPSAILLDPMGLNTSATVRNTTDRDIRRGARVMAVSEFYHLPRIKLAYAAAGVDVFTVPARPRHWAREWPVKNIAREVPAFWFYFARSAAAAIRFHHA